MRIPRHPVDLELATRGFEHFQGLYDQQLKGAATELAQAGPEIAGRLADYGNSALMLLRYRTVLDPNGRTTLRSILDAGSLHLGGLFAAAAMPLGAGEWSFTAPSGQVVQLVGTGPSAHAHARHWIDCFCLAVVARHGAVLDSLVQLPEPVLRQSPTRCPEYMHFTVAALRELRYSKTRPAAELASKALHAVFQRLEGNGGDPSVLQIRVAELQMFMALTLGDRAAFNRFTQKTMELHRRFWSAPGRPGDPRGWLSVLGLALVTLAHRGGERMSVRSDYIPESLIYW